MATKATLPSTAVGRRRLLKLAGLLEADAKNKKGIKFDLKTWGHADDPANPISCGTMGCAMGLAVASKAFTRAGLLPDDNGSLRPIFKPKNGRKKSNFDAAAALFEIGYYEAQHLFSANSYDRDQQQGADGERGVAKRIRDFVAGRAAP